jgi:hypothetical protein
VLDTVFSGQILDLMILTRRTLRIPDAKIRALGEKNQGFPD